MLTTTRSSCLDGRSRRVVPCDGPRLSPGHEPFSDRTLLPGTCLVDFLFRRGTPAIRGCRADHRPGRRGSRALLGAGGRRPRPAGAGAPRGSVVAAGSSRHLFSWRASGAATQRPDKPGLSWPPPACRLRPCPSRCSPRCSASPTPSSFTGPRGARRARPWLVSRSGPAPAAALGWGRAILRWLGAALGLACAGLGLFWAVFEPRRRGWADLISGTVVARPQREPTRG